MNIISLQYIFFVILIFILYSITPQKFKWAILLIGSIAFYFSSGLLYLIIALVAVTLITFCGAKWIHTSGNEKRKKTILTSTIIGGLIPLILLKYTSSLVLNISNQLGITFDSALITSMQSLVTLGVSFYTFQGISYVIDVYYERIDPENHIGFYALYISFFPKLIQGPIERGADLLPQLHKSYQFEYSTTRDGLVQIAWGVFKKVVLAERLAMFVNPVYNNVHNYAGLPLLLATFLYAFQIYFDFSGYTDIALGTAKLFGINLTQNFNRPYLASSIQEFWRRWHISFSRWILDYIFMPLQYKWRHFKYYGPALALIITFLISGIWHGNHWGFLVWGGLHGIYMVLAYFINPLEKRMIKKFRLEKSKLLKILQVFITFNLVCFSWIFFRANNLSDAFYIVKHLFTGIHIFINQLISTGFSFTKIKALLTSLLLNQKGSDALTLVLLLVFMVFITIITKKEEINSFLNKKSVYLRWISYYFLLAIIVFLGIFENRVFIYNQF